MDLLEYLEKTYNDCSNPCFVQDYETEELLFVNQSLEKKFQIFQSYHGKSVAEVFRGFVEKEDFCDKTLAVDGDYVEKRIYSNGLQAHLRSNTTLLNKCGRKLLMTKYFMTSVDKKRADSEHTFDHAMSQCLEILRNPDRQQCMQGLLSLLCQFYSCELAYICEYNNNNSSLTEKYYYNNQENSFPKTHKETIAKEEFLTWLQESQSKEIITLEAQNNQSKEGQALEKLGLDNITLHKLTRPDESLLGMVCLSNRTQPIYDDRLLKVISHFVMERYSEENTLKIIESLNERDMLTGFFNRRKYGERLVELQRNPPKTLGVLFINLNGLRKTNEYFGFEVGDVQIKKTAGILQDYFTEEFYRISGDEFVGFMTDWNKADFGGKVDELHEHLKSTTNEVNFSIGHSWDSGQYNVSNLVKVADTVMVVNKQAFYFNALHDNEDILDTILRDLFRALAEDEFLVYLQPQINLDTEEVVGAEALIRRYDRKHQKMVLPDNFIPLYEKNSIIRHVDLFMIRKVCQILMDWNHHQHAMPISVNLSRVTLMEHGIVNTITEILDEYDVPHELIVIEITERIGIVESEVTKELVDNFKEQGFRLSLDDFGCAYSNIVTLSQIAVDEVKIDKSLVDNLISNSKNRVIVKNMLLMCNELEDTFSLAEGIETEEQAEGLTIVPHFGFNHI